MRPLIGISAWTKQNGNLTVSSVNLAYIQAVDAAGGLPVFLTPGLSRGALNEWLSRLDGLVLTGGGDLNPKYWGEERHELSDVPNDERDEFDLYLANWALTNQVPFLGICRGMQTMAVVSGGSLHQHIGEEHRLAERRPEIVHTASVQPDSLLGRLTGVQELGMNSVHHQAVNRLAERFQVVARAADGTVEAYEEPSLPFCLCVQWHPEALASAHDEHAAIFRGLIEAASRGSR